MKSLVKIGGTFAVLQAVSFAITAQRGFGLRQYLDASFLVGLVGLIGSGFYYLASQRAFAGLGASVQKFGYAIVELFSKKDFTEQRRTVNAAGKQSEHVRKNCEYFVGSALIMLVDFVIIYLLPPVL